MTQSNAIHSATGHPPGPEFPQDRDVRLRCLDPEESFIVQAPAGAGKTELLIQRFLKLLARVEHPDEVVAITFTRKAAAEMRQRVLAALKRGHNDTVPELAHERVTWELSREVLANDRERGWVLERYPSRLSISTIDGLCQSITRQLPLMVRLGVGPSVVTGPDLERCYRGAARNALRCIQKEGAQAEAIAKILLHLDNNTGRTEGLIVELLRRRDQWLRHIRPGDPARLRRVLEASLERMVCGLMETVAGLWPAHTLDATAQLARAAAAGLVHGESGRNPISALAAMESFPACGPGDLEHWQGLAELLLTQSGSWRKRPNKNQGFPPASSGKTQQDKDRLKSQHDRMEELLFQLSNRPGLADALHGLRGLAVRYPDHQWEALEALMAVLPAAVETLAGGFAAEGAVDHTEVALAVTNALNGEEADASPPPGIQRIRHLLIDEFQDTSVSQYHLIRGLTQAWEADGSRTLFLVGDPMQSIYGFREAAVGIFLRVLTEGLGSLKPRRLTLSVNFRSARSVIGWVNRAFPEIMPREPDAEAGAVPYTTFQPRPEAPAGLAVGLHPFDGIDQEAEAQMVLSLVRSAHARKPSGTVAILVRMRSHLTRIVPALRAGGLPFRAMDIDPLATQPVIQDLLALTRALRHPADRVAWLSVLRAPWCGLTLSDLWMLTGGQPYRTLWSCMTDGGLTAALSGDGRERLQRVTDALQPCVAGRQRGPLRRQVERAWLNLGGATGLTDGDLDNADSYLAMLERLEQTGAIDSSSTLEHALEDLKSAPDPRADDTLQLMTIHHAKGLEFDTVIIPGLGRPPRAEEKALLMWMERPGGDGNEDDLILAPIGETGGSDDALFAHLRSLSKQKSGYERGRLLYVAMTRARESLHLLGHATRDKEGTFRPNASSLLATLWPAVEADFERFEPEQPPQGPGGGSSQDADGSSGHTELLRLPADWRLPQAPTSLQVPSSTVPVAQMPEEPVEYSWAGDTARHVGTVVHRTLQQIARTGVAAWSHQRIEQRRPTFRAALTRLGLSQDDIDAATARVIQALTRTLDDERGRWLLKDHEDAHSELSLGASLDGQGTHVVLDRTFVDSEGARWIVDYKTSSHEGAGVDSFLDREQERYRSQLDKYARIMALREPQRAIRLALYFPLLQAWREWPAG